MKNNILNWLFFLITSNMMANVSLPDFFSDNMVLQRNAEVNFWGWANPGEEIKIKTSWDEKEYVLKPDNQANWKLKIKTPEAGGPYTISIKGYNEIILKNILIGEIWLCSGQSNMEMTPSWGITNGDEEVNKAINSNIRFFNVPKMTATSPQISLNGDWTECSPETFKNFSAVAYFFGKRLQEDLENVPIGLISSNWGGTSAEIWIPEQTILNDPLLLKSAKKINPENWGPSEPGRAYNAMIHPLVGYNIAGVIWYQGETNVGADSYDKTLSALIASWRMLWKNNFPFYFVQIAPFNYGNNNEGGAVIRNAQRKVLHVMDNTGMVVTSDISTIDDIHPKDKKTVGVRLANLALANTYKTNSNLVNGPLYREIKISKDKVTVYFDYTEELYFKNKKCEQFEISGSDSIFYPAIAEIKNNNIVLHSEKVKSPVKVRFAWKNTAQSELFNKANLPASTFVSE